jgi:hypothetical protein
VETEAGVRVEAQMWFRCYGNLPASDYLAGDLMGARNGHRPSPGSLRKNRASRSTHATRPQ